ncbi:MAG: DUF4157 domain-containing protein [Leptospirales bacterium]
MSNFQHTHKTGSSAEKKSSSSKTSTTSSSSRPQYPQGIHNARDYIMHLQRTIGNQAVGRLLKSGWLQRKLNIGPANDKYEQEADAVADKVVSMGEPQVGSADSLGNSSLRETQQISRTPLADSITPLQRETAPEEEDVQKASAKDEEEPQAKFIQSKCATCEKEETQAKLQRRPVNQASLCPKCRSNSPLQMMQRKCIPVRVNPMNRQLTPPTNYHIQKKATGSTPASSNIESSIQSSRGGGRSLSAGERSYYEPRFGTSFGGVKIHTDSKAAHLSRSVNARAFTVGRDVFFGAGQYSPNTVQGKRLMAHELTHTVQQGGSLQRKPAQGGTGISKKKENPYIIDSNKILYIKVKKGEGLIRVLSRAFKYSMIKKVAGKPFDKLMKDVATWNDVQPAKLKIGQTIEVPKAYLQPQKNYDHVKIIPRRDWGAKDPVTDGNREYNEITFKEKVYDSIVIHHSGNSGMKTMNEVQEDHMDADDPRADIGYHYGVNMQGHIFQGRSIDITGSHVDRANTGKIGIVLLADLDTKDENMKWYKELGEWSDDELTKKMDKAAMNLILKLKSQFPLIEFLGGHKEYDTRRACPGDLGMAVINKWRTGSGLQKPKPVR